MTNSDCDDDDYDKIETCSSQGRTRVLSHLIPHSSGTRCPQLVTLYDMQEDAAGQILPPNPQGVVDCDAGTKRWYYRVPFTTFANSNLVFSSLWQTATCSCVTWKKRIPGIFSSQKLNIAAEVRMWSYSFDGLCRLAFVTSLLTAITGSFEFRCRVGEWGRCVREWDERKMVTRKKTMKEYELCQEQGGWEGNMSVHLFMCEIKIWALSLSILAYTVNTSINKILPSLNIVLAHYTLPLF